MKFLSFTTLTLVAAAVAGCGGSDSPIPTELALAQNCAGLKGSTIAASLIGAGSTTADMTTSGASVTDATIVAGAGSLPQYCKVTGSIAAATTGSPAINF